MRSESKINSRRILLLWVAVSFLGTLGGMFGGAQQAFGLQQRELILEGETFSVDDRPAFIMWPKEELRSTPQPWVMYSPTLPRYPDVHEKWMHQQFLDAGIAVAGIDVGEAYGSPESRGYFTKLYNELTQNRGFAAKLCLLGRSRGGLWASSWAIENTDKVAGLAGIYPVFDLTTYPGLKNAAPAYGLSESELKSLLSQHNPIEKVGKLAEAKVPVFIIHGKIDKVVPLKENSARFMEVYKTSGAEDVAELEVVDDQGHNYFEGFFKSQKLVDFVIKQAKQAAKE